jgi:hypothetical protein
MSIFDINIETFEQNFTSTEGNKDKNGEVHTDFKLIHDMLNLIPKKCFENPTFKWLDPCAGRGYFGMVIYKKLFKGLENFFPDEKERHNHIVNRMLYMVEINPDFIPILKNMFGENCHIYNESFLLHQRGAFYDFVIGNPPYNVAGNINITVAMGDIPAIQKSGKGCWSWFIHKALSVLKGRGYLSFITPSIWMKKDHPMYLQLLRYNMKYIYTLNNTETNKIFHGNAQTPTCYFLLRRIIKRSTVKLGPIKVFDKAHNKYITFRPTPSTSIPLFGVSIIDKLQKFVGKAGHIAVTKTNMRPGYKGLITGPGSCAATPWPNITTCKLNGLQPQLVINFSNIQCAFQGVSKLVLAHKMYGFPFLDISGVFGVSNRDNYVIFNKTKQELEKLQKFLSTNFIITLFEATRYRMKYLERYIFNMLPDITQLTDFPEDITDETLFDYFKLNEVERNLINTFHKKRYLSF